MQNYSVIISRLTGSKSGYLNDWEKGFVESVSAQFERKGTLSPKQVEWLKKFDDKYSDEGIASLEDWKQKFRNCPKMQSTFSVCAGYYKRTGYYGNIVVKWEMDPQYVPSELEYKKLTSNKYAQKVLAAFYAEPRYDVGSYVACRAARRNVVKGGKGIRLRSWEQDPVQNLFVVLTNNGTPTSAAKGSKKYKIMHMGENIVIDVEERDIKKYRG